MKTRTAIIKARRPNKRIALAVAMLVLVACSVGIAVAAVTSQQVLTDTTSVRLRIVRTAADGFDSGWHEHPGPAIVQVQEGYFKIYQRSCAPTIVAPGETYVEVPNLPVRAVANGEIKWTTTLIIPSGEPPLTPVESPCP